MADIMENYFIDIIKGKGLKRNTVHVLQQLGSLNHKIRHIKIVFRD